MSGIFVALLCLIFPALALYLKEKVPLFAKWSPLIACYVGGLLFGNLGLLPEGSVGVLDGISTVAVALAIPLLLFSVDIRRWRELTGKAGLAFILAAIAVVAISVLAHFIFRDRIPDSAKVAGMLVGVYTGGTPNLAAIKTALGVDMNAYLAVHSADIVLSAIYFFFVLTAAKRFFGLFLPPYRGAGLEVGNSSAGSPVEEAMPFSGLFKKGVRLPLLGALGLDLLVVGAGLGLSFLVPSEWQTMIVILAITTFSLLASLSARIRTIPGSFAAGEFILYVFCFAVGAMGDFSKIIGAAPSYFLYVALVLFGSFALHSLLCALFRVDVDTMLVVSTATINSPPFVGLACVAINNRSLLVPGITIGILGYAVGNYLGILLANILGA